MSTLDENGILVYDETDTRDTFSELLNMGQSATSDAIGADRARLAVLETAGQLGAVGVPGVAADGWALDGTQRGRRIGGLAFIAIGVKRTGGTITVPPSGDVPNVPLFTLSAGWAAAAGMPYPGSAGAYGRLNGSYVDAATVNLVSVAPGTNIVNGDTIYVYAVYPLG